METDGLDEATRWRGGGRRGATGQRVEAEEDEATLVDVVDHPPNTLQFFCACLWQAMPTSSTPTLSTTNSPSTSANSTPRPLSPPLLTLNGSPIAPPSSSAYPPLSPARKRRSSNAKMSASQKQLNPSYQRPRPAAGRSTSSTSSSSGHASRTKNVAIPNPILHPLAFASWIKWRISVWLLGHLALGMLTDVEIFLLCEYASPSPMPLPPTRRSSFALTSPLHARSRRHQPPHLRRPLLALLPPAQPRPYRPGKGRILPLRS